MLSPAGGERPLTPEEQSRQRTGASRSTRTEDRLAGDAVGQQPPVFPEGLANRVPAGAVHPPHVDGCAQPAARTAGRIIPPLKEATDAITRDLRGGVVDGACADDECARRC